LLPGPFFHANLAAAAAHFEGRPRTVRLEGVAAQTGRQVTVNDVAPPYSGTISNPPLAGQCTIGRS
jgi:hypothetical protein